MIVVPPNLTNSPFSLCFTSIAIIGPIFLYPKSNISDYDHPFEGYPFGTTSMD